MWFLDMLVDVVTLVMFDVLCTIRSCVKIIVDPIICDDYLTVFIFIYGDDFDYDDPYPHTHTNEFCQPPEYQGPAFGEDVLGPCVGQRFFPASPKKVLGLGFSLQESSGSSTQVTHAD